MQYLHTRYCKIANEKVHRLESNVNHIYSRAAASFEAVQVTASGKKPFTDVFRVFIITYLPYSLRCLEATVVVNLIKIELNLL